MNSTIDLVWFSQGVKPPAWNAGAVRSLAPTPSAVIKESDSSSKSKAEAVFFWDSALGRPDERLAQELIGSPGDCWHAGLRLGMAGLPGMLDFVSPTWMLACDPPQDIEATSWRLTLQACLVRTEVLRKLGGLSPGFVSLEAAALEMGHRWIRRGALMRHIPGLIPSEKQKAESGKQKLDGTGQKAEEGGWGREVIAFEDELRFAYYRFGRKWAAWGLFRALMTGYTKLSTAVPAWRKVMSGPRPAEPEALRQHYREDGSGGKAESGRQKAESETVVSQPSTSNLPRSVSVLIPTLDRYSYLRTLLGQLRHQTVAPLEIIIVDQTAPDRRETQLAAEFSDLPLKTIFQDEPGQCTSRNAGLQMARGDYVLFIDDDDEVQPDLIEAHLHSLAQFRADVSCGVADEVGAGALPPDFCLIRASDVFPTNNTMIRREILGRSGLFDLAYNRRQRADGDLGMRVYLSGASMVVNPVISVLHHHAPAGGLRKHKARTVTYAMSRSRIFCRALASASEIYLARRYFSDRHLGEMLQQSILGTFSIRGGFGKRLAKVLVSTFCLPQSIARLRQRNCEAMQMSKVYPQIPKLQRKELTDPVASGAPCSPHAKSIALAARAASAHESLKHP